MAADDGVPGADHGPRLGRRARPVAAPVHSRGGRLRARDPVRQADGAGRCRLGALHASSRGSAAVDLAPDRSAAPLRSRGCGTGDADRPDPCPRQRRALDQLGRPGRRDADLRRWRRHCPGPRTVPATGTTPLRQRLRDGGELRRPARQLGAPRDQHRRHLGRLDPRRRGAEDLTEAADRQPGGLGCRSRLRRLPTAGSASVRDGPGRRHPPHGQRQRLHARGGAIDRPRHLPLPRLRQRLERHRLQRARRPLRDAL